MQIIPISHPSKKQRALVVSIHDVSPLTQSSVEIMLNDLQRIGIVHCSLLVIPDHHNGGMISDDHHFSEWLQHQIEKGHEVVLHGFNHLRPEVKAESCLTRWITKYYTMGEGEFYDLEKEEAHQKLRAGIEQLHKIGVKASPLGFIAPAWLLSAQAEKAVQEDGFLYTTRLGGMTVFSSDGSKKEYSSQSMVYSPRSALRRFISLLWNELLFNAAKKWSLLRIGLHPPDWKYQGIRKHALFSIRRAVSNRSVMTYREWVLKQGAF